MCSVKKVAKAIERSWSLRSSTLWTSQNPAAGQCGVTALVASDELGGEILKTRHGPIWHFYNRIDGQRHDFTESQFGEPIHYDDLPSTRDEAFGDTNPHQYAYLGNAVKRSLAQGTAD